jgi:hypothetical protein
MADWYPGSRDGQMHMVDSWLQVFQTKASAWNIPYAARRGNAGTGRKRQALSDEGAAFRPHNYFVEFCHRQNSELGLPNKYNFSIFLVYKFKTAVITIALLHLYT